VGPVIEQFGFASVGLDRQLLFALLELGLEGKFFVLQVLFQTRISFARLHSELTFEIGHAAAHRFLGLRLRLSDPGLGLRI